MSICSGKCSFISSLIIPSILFSLSRTPIIPAIYLQDILLLLFFNIFSLLLFIFVSCFMSSTLFSNCSIGFCFCFHIFHLLKLPFLSVGSSAVLLPLGWGVPERGHFQCHDGVSPGQSGMGSHLHLVLSFGSSFIFFLGCNIVSFFPSENVNYWFLEDLCFSQYYALSLLFFEFLWFPYFSFSFMLETFPHCLVICNWWSQLRV